MIKSHRFIWYNMTGLVSPEIGCYVFLSGLLLFEQQLPLFFLFFHTKFACTRRMMRKRSLKRSVKWLRHDHCCTGSKEWENCHDDEWNQCLSSFSLAFFFQILNICFLSSFFLSLFSFLGWGAWAISLCKESYLFFYSSVVVILNVNFSQFT